MCMARTATAKHSSRSNAQQIYAIELTCKKNRNPMIDDIMSKVLQPVSRNAKADTIS